MGISGLLPRLQSITTEINIKSFKGKILAVDGYVWLHRGSYACSAELCQNIPTDKYISYFLNMVGLLTHNGITPLIVFDGNRLPAKSLQEEERHKKREDNRQKAFELLRQGKRSAAHEAFQRCVDVTPAMAARVIRALEAKKIKCIVAPYEADAQLTYLVNNGHADAVITEDSDLLAFGCPKVIFKMDKFGNGKQIDLVDLPKNQDLPFVGWSHDMFRHMCILAGCDYLPAMHGVGVKKAYGLLKKYRTVERILQIIQEGGEKFTVPHGYHVAFERANLTFLHQTIYDPETETTVPLTPLPESLSESTDISFLGKPVEPETAKLVANGKMDPIEMKMFAENILRPSNASSLRRSYSSPSAAIHKRKREDGHRSTSWFPSSSFGRRDEEKAFGNGAEGEEKTITSFFTPVANRSQKPFTPPTKKQIPEQGGGAERELTSPAPPTKRPRLHKAPLSSARPRLVSSQPTVVRSRFFKQKETPDPPPPKEKPPPVPLSDIAQEMEEFFQSPDVAAAVAAASTPSPSSSPSTSTSPSSSSPPPSSSSPPPPSSSQASSQAASPSSMWFASPLVSEKRLSARTTPSFSTSLQRSRVSASPRSSPSRHTPTQPSSSSFCTPTRPTTPSSKATSTPSPSPINSFSKFQLSEKKDSRMKELQQRFLPRPSRQQNSPSPSPSSPSPSSPST